MALQKIFSERFRSLRNQGENQVEFAKRLGISRPTVAQYENEKRIADSEILVQICLKCSVSADWLLGLSDIRFRDPDYEKMLVDASRLLDDMKKQSVQYLLYMTKTISKLDAIEEPVLQGA